MKLIIDIPEEEYKRWKEDGEMDAFIARDALVNGVPLPKNHGRLIDEREAIGIIAEGKNGKAYFGTLFQDWEVIDFLKTVPTVIGEAQGMQNER